MQPPPSPPLQPDIADLKSGLPDSSGHNLALALSQAHALLGEVLDYMRRLPPVPVTKDFVARIEQQLDEPALGFLRRRAEEARAAAVELHGGEYLRQGEPLVLLRMRDRQLTITSPGIDRRPKAAALLLDRISHGYTTQLEPRSGKGL